MIRVEDMKFSFLYLIAVISVSQNLSLNSMSG